MALIRDYSIRSLLTGTSMRFACTGRLIAIRRSSGFESLNVKAYSQIDGGELLIDCTLEAGEKIISRDEFKLVEITNVNTGAIDATITAGYGGFESDIVEGNVQVTNTSSQLDSMIIDPSVNSFPFTVSPPVGTFNMILYNNSNDALAIAGGFVVPSGATLEVPNTQNTTIDSTATSGLIHILFSKYV